MKKIIHTIIVLSVSILISSCAQVQVVNIDKNNNTRTVKFTHDNGSIKFINQKLSLKNNSWFEAECLEANFKKFENCPVDKVRGEMLNDFGIEIKSWKNSLIEALVAIKLQKSVNTN